MGGCVQSRSLSRTETIEEAEFLCGTDDPDSIGRRLGFTDRDGLYRFLNRNGRHDLTVRIGRYRGAIPQSTRWE